MARLKMNVFLSTPILIVDYQSGNLNSVAQRLHKCGATFAISDRPDDILAAEKLILPGVGHFGQAMQRLSSTGLASALTKAVVEQKKPILGICLGMQLMARKSEEGLVEGLGWFDAEVVRFRVNDRAHFKVPHTGWNTVRQRRHSRLLSGLPDSSEFYFIHSYHWSGGDPDVVAGSCLYELEFAAVIERDNVFGVQFHPEKSHDLGAQLMQRFVEL